MIAFTAALLDLWKTGWTDTGCAGALSIEAGADIFPWMSVRGSTNTVQSQSWAMRLYSKAMVENGVFTVSTHTAPIEDGRTFEPRWRGPHSTILGVAYFPRIART